MKKKTVLSVKKLTIVNIFVLVSLKIYKLNNFEDVSVKHTGFH